MIVVFTAILGGSDSLKPAPAGADRCVCFVDEPTAYPDAMGWELVRHEYQGDPRFEAWRLRCVPHALFPYDRSVWVDASFTVTDLPRILRDAGDAPIAALRHHTRRNAYQEAAEIVKVKQASAIDIGIQVRAYRASGFNVPHLSISCLIVRDHSADVQRFNETWLDQIRMYRGDNTQVSLDYAAWTNGLTIKALTGTRHKNPYATHDHADHKQRRKPYRSAA